MITSAALAAFGMGTMLTADSAQAAKKQRSVDEVQQALKEQYPDAKLEKTGDRQINGVQVSDYRVTTKEGDSTAEITQYGDFVLWGKPRVATQGQAMSQPARDTLSGLFKGSTNDVDVFQTTFYAVDVQTASNKGGKQQTFRLRFDPVGRLRTVEKVTAENKSNGMIEGMDKATGADAQKAQDYAKKYVKDANVESVYSVPGEEGFYLVDIRAATARTRRSPSATPAESCRRSSRWTRASCRRRSRRRSTSISTASGSRRRTARTRSSTSSTSRPPAATSPFASARTAR